MALLDPWIQVRSLTRRLNPSMQDGFSVSYPSAWFRSVSYSTVLFSNCHEPFVLLLRCIMGEYPSRDIERGPCLDKDDMTMKLN